MVASPFAIFPDARVALQSEPGEKLVSIPPALATPCSCSSSSIQRCKRGTHPSRPLYTRVSPWSAPNADIHHLRSAIRSASLTTSAVSTRSVTRNPLHIPSLAEISSPYTFPHIVHIASQMTPKRAIPDKMSVRQPQRGI